MAVFSATTMFIAVPTGVKIINWLATMWGGRLWFTTAMLFAIGLVVEFTVGGLSGVTHAVVPVGHAADRHVLHRRPLPLRALRRRSPRTLRRLLLLVAEGVRSHAERDDSASGTSG